MNTKKRKNILIFLVFLVLSLFISAFVVIGEDDSPPDDETGDDTGDDDTDDNEPEEGPPVDESPHPSEKLDLCGEYAHGHFPLREGGFELGGGGAMDPDEVSDLPSPISVPISKVFASIHDI